MILKHYILEPSSGSHAWSELNKNLRGSVHVDTYLKDQGRYGGDKTLYIYAFYPDDIEEGDEDE